jgi:glycosyltransferase involved in cell wall biosynthesis
VTKPDDLPAVLFFGNDWYAENRTSSHHIARWLARERRVYYVECPGLRAPQKSGRDLRKVGAKLARFLRGARAAGPNLKVRTLLQVPLHRFRLVRRLNRALILLTLRWLMWREGVRGPVAWFMVPHLAPVAGRLGECCSVYYCIDDYASLPGVNADAVRAMDEELTRRADLVFVASETLLEDKRRLNPASRVSPHGVDADHFARARDPGLAVPPEVRDLPGPVVGFFGLIERWIDLDLIGYLAERRPHWSFVLIGHVAVPQDQVPRGPNIHYLGKRPYEDLPAYGKRFDAAVIPYRPTRQVYHANPIKLREYLAMGKPVVTVRTPEIEKYADVVAIADSYKEFLARLDQALARPADPGEAARRAQRVAPEGWDARLRQVMAVVGRRADPAAAGQTAAGVPPGPREGVLT